MANDKDNADNEKTLPVVVPGEAAPDPYLVAFDTPHGLVSPRDWSLGRKWLVTSVLSCTGFNRIMVSTIIAPALPQIEDELRMNSVESLMALSVYVLATAFGPLFIGPLSEMYGRSPVLHTTNVWFMIWNLVCGFAPNKATLITSRLLAGLGASAIYSLGSGVLGDIWPPEQRGRSMGLYMLIPLLGAAVGPIIGGYIADGNTWRWIFWATSIIQAGAVAFSFAFYRETHLPTILERQAARLRKSTGDPRYHTQVSNTNLDQSYWSILTTHLTRPFRLLAFHPIIQITTILSGFDYGLLYLLLATYSSLWTHHYHESTSSSGLHYLSMCLGEIVGSQAGGILMDLTYRSLKRRSPDQEGRAEFRIPLMFPSFALTVLGLLLYGWPAQYRLPWPVVDTGMFISSLGSSVVGQILNAYMIDAYPDHVASAFAASQLVRSLTAFGFPLFAPAMFGQLGYGWASVLLAGVAVLLGFPAAALLWRYGESLRKRARSSY